jgi:hypothetical protein
MKLKMYPVIDPLPSSDEIQKCILYFQNIINESIEVCEGPHNVQVWSDGRWVDIKYIVRKC